MFLNSTKDWRKIDVPIVLASQSPRRKDILSQMGLSFTISPADLPNEESYLDPENLVPSLNDLAIAKAQFVAKNNPHALVIGADTVVVNKKCILGKPKDDAHALKMLQSLSGIEHKVITSVAIMHLEENFVRCRSNITKVFFRNLTNNEIEQYLSTGEHRDKAGAYAIQGKGMIFIDHIEGCYYNVVGMPVALTIALLQEFIVRKDSAHV